MAVLGAPVFPHGNLAFFVAIFSEMTQLSVGVGPVSYTHLDVYKRQVCINTGIACLFSFQIFRTTLSVLSPFPGCDAAGCHAFLADSWNKAFSSD